MPYLYLDPSISGPQVNKRAKLLDNSEANLSLEENELSYRMMLDGVMDYDEGDWVCRATIPEANFAAQADVRIDIYGKILFMVKIQVRLKYF